MNYPTWSDLNDESIIPPLGTRQAPDIGPVAIMVSCAPDLKRIAANAEGLTALPFFNSTLFINREEGISVTGPFIGSPYAAMLLESLIARGAKKVLVMGWCGALTQEFKVGDILLPSRALADEGTSRHYRPPDQGLPVSIPDMKLLLQLSDYLSGRRIIHKTTDIWTTDAIYRETKQKKAFFSRQGASAVEMECSALFSVAQYRKISIAGLLIVSDSLASHHWEPGFRQKTFKQARLTACKALMEFSKTL